MASAVWSGGHGCGEVRRFRGEEFLLGAPGWAEPHGQWLGSGDCRDGHLGFRREETVRPAEETVGQMKRLVLGEPSVGKAKAFTVSCGMAVRRIPQGATALEGDQLLGLVAGEKQVGRLMLPVPVPREKEVDDGPAEMGGNRTPCAVSWGRAARRVAQRRVPQVQGTQHPTAGDQKLAEAAERAPAPWWRRKVARRTLPVDLSPLKKAMVVGDKRPPVVQRTAALRKKRKFARRSLPVGVGPLKKATAAAKDPQELDQEAEVVVVGEAASAWADMEGREACMVPRCDRSVDAYERLDTVGQGAYGVVFRGRERETGEMVALKMMNMDDAALREIGILASLRRHPHIVGFKEVVFDADGPEDSVYMVMEYADHDLCGVLQGMGRPFRQSEAKFFMWQLLQGIQYVHANGVLHRDLKTSNVLVTSCGVLKVCDFGLSRHCSGDDVGVQQEYTDWVVTLWYRAPELLLKAKGYSAAIDMWSVGCIMAELLGRAPLFRGCDARDQLDQIFDILGTPDERTWPGFTDLCDQASLDFPTMQPCSDGLREKLPPTTLSEAGYDLLRGLLTYDPARRLTAEQAMHHQWFRELPLPTRVHFTTGGD